MTLQFPKNDFNLWPGYMRYHSSANVNANRTVVDAAGKYHAVCFCAQEDMTISHVFFKPGAVSGSPTAEIRVETIDSGTGLPTGTLWATNTNATTATLTTSGALTALTASASVSRGQWVCIKFQYASGTSFTTDELAALVNSSAFVYSAINTGTPTKGAVLGCMMAVGSSTTTFYQIPANHYPITSFPGSGNINNSTGARCGARFKVPFSCEIFGVVVGLPTVAAFDVTFYDDAGSAISGATASAQLGPLVGLNARAGILIGTPFTPTVGTFYRCGIVPTSGSNINLRTAAVPSADYMTAMPGQGNFLRTDYTTAGGWSETNAAQLPCLDLMIRRLDDGAGSGGGGGGIVIGGD